MSKLKVINDLENYVENFPKVPKRFEELVKEDLSFIMGYIIGVWSNKYSRETIKDYIQFSIDGTFNTIEKLKLKKEG